MIHRHPCPHLLQTKTLGCSSSACHVALRAGSSRFPTLGDGSEWTGGKSVRASQGLRTNQNVVRQIYPLTDSESATVYSNCKQKQIHVRQNNKQKVYSVFIFSTFYPGCLRGWRACMMTVHSLHLYLPITEPSRVYWWWIFIVLKNMTKKIGSTLIGGQDKTK